jgi:hypothetical protein
MCVALRRVVGCRSIAAQARRVGEDNGRREPRNQPTTDNAGEARSLTDNAPRNGADYSL